MKYAISTGLEQKKNNFKKYVVGTVAALGIAGAMAIPALAATPTVSSHASTTACFGQWRAENASGPYNAGGEGAALSARQGYNSTENVLDKAACAPQQ